jgi:hypothetical protein
MNNIALNLRSGLEALEERTPIESGRISHERAQMPTLSKEIGRSGSAIKRSVEQTVIEISFSRISRNGGGNLRSARNFEQGATEFPQGEPSWQNAEPTHCAISRRR